MARPSFKDRSQVRDRRIGFAVDESESRLIDESANAAGMTAGAYARAVVLGHEVKAAPAPIPQVDIETLKQLSGVASNVNQAMHSINEGKGNPAKWDELYGLLANIRMLMERIYRANGITWSVPSPMPLQRQKVNTNKEVSEVQDSDKSTHEDYGF